MNNFRTLIKTSLNLNFGLSALKYRFTKEKKKRWEPVLIGFSILLGVGSIVFLYTMMMQGIFHAGRNPEVNSPEIVLTTAFLMGQMFVLLFGIFYIMGAFYFSKDMDILIPLPLKPYEVLGSKIIVIMVNEYLTLLPLLLPPLIIYGAGTGQGLLYWLKGGILILTSPVIPLVLSACIIMVLMRFVNFRKSKDLLAVIGGIFGLFLSLGLNLFFSRIPEGNEGEFFSRFFASQAGVIEQIGKKFPPSVWATYGLSQQGSDGWMYFLLFVIVSAIGFLLLLWLGNILFYRSVVSGQEVSRKRKKLSEEEAGRSFEKASSPVKALFLREWRMLLRTPVYVLNGLVGNVIGPFIVGVMLVTGENNREMSELLVVLQSSENALYVTLGGLALMLFTAGMNLAASTALSREGSTFWISKMIPVPPKQQATAKLLMSMLVSLIGIMITAIIFYVFLGFSIERVLIVTLFGILGAVILSTVSLMIDIAHPKLQWKNPTEAMKQNVNGLLGILASLAIMALLAGFTYLLLTVGVSDMVLFLVLGVFMLLLGVASVSALHVIAERKYASLDA